MKNYKYLIAFLTVSSVIIISILSLTTQSGSVHMTDRFYLGVFNFFQDTALRNAVHKQWYRELSYNSMHNYCYHLDSSRTIHHNVSYDVGFFDDSMSNYTDIMKILDDWNEIPVSSSPNSLIYEREKILRPCYGQRSTYEAEEYGTWSNRYPGYGYQQSGTGEDYSSNGINGRCCLVSRGDTAGYIVRDLYENCEQVNNTDTVDIDNTGKNLYSDIKRKVYNYHWYIKPRMRIDPNTAMSYPDTPVVRIEILSFDSSYKKTVDILCKNFIDTTTNYYDGSYMDIYNKLNDPLGCYNLSISATDLARGKGDNNFLNSKVDYRVYWYGKVDVWLDYVLSLIHI